jgi:NADPH:quinone reductase-like Zn-dependent oxidoreductase
MRAIGFTEFGGPEVFRELRLDELHAGPGEVRIRIRAAAVNPSDSLTRSGRTKQLLAEQVPDLAYPPPPYVVGWDIAGVIDEVGPDTAGDCAVGDRVCAVTPMGLGGYAEHAVVSARSAVPAPANADDAAACTLPMNGLTARVAVDRLGLPAGATVAVTGAAGTLGGYVVQLAKADGLRVVADASEADEALVRSLGADEIVRRGDDVAKRIRQVCPDGVDGLVDCAVQDDLVLDAVRDGGAIATVRFFAGSTERDITWHPVFVGEHVTDQARLDHLRQQVEDGALTLRVAETFPAEQAAEAHRRLEAGGVRGRLVLTF